MFRALIVLTMLIALPVHGHHSRANFDSSKRTTISGILTDFQWKNPHVYMEVEVADNAGIKQRWLVEGHSVTGLQRLGWNANTLKVGQSITLTGQPDRNPAKHFLLLDNVQMADGSTLSAFGNRGQTAPVIEPSRDFTGTWSMDMRSFNVREAGGGPPADWVYTPKARARLAAFSVEANPELKCLAIGVPRIIIYPYALNLSREGNVLKIHKEHLNEKRTIQIGGSLDSLKSRPASTVGTSVATFDNKQTLRIQSTNFTPTLWGIANGVDSSASKSVEEVYRLSDDGLVLEVNITVTDPEIISKPVILTARFLKEPNRNFIETQCDPVAASRHLTAK